VGSEKWIFSAIGLVMMVI